MEFSGSGLLLRGIFLQSEFVQTKPAALKPTLIDLTSPCHKCLETDREGGSRVRENEMIGILQSELLHTV